MTGERNSLRPLSLPRCLALLQHSEAGGVLEKALRKMETDLANGLPLSESVEQTRLLEPSLRQVLQVGEQTVEMAPPLLAYADLREQDLQRQLGLVTTALNLIFLSGSGLFCCLIAVMVFYPMIALVEKL